MCLSPLALQEDGGPRAVNAYHSDSGPCAPACFDYPLDFAICIAVFSRSRSASRRNLMRRREIKSYHGPKLFPARRVDLRRDARAPFYPGGNKGDGSINGRGLPNLSFWGVRAGESSIPTPAFGRSARPTIRDRTVARG